MSKNAQTALENLRLAIHGVTSPFSCEGTFVPDKPVTFVFKDQTRFEVTRAKSPFDQKNELKPLLEHCKPAPFGDGKKTRYDRTVRDALQLKAENGGFAVENFDPESAGILKAIQRELVPHDPNPISAELYTRQRLYRWRALRPTQGHTARQRHVWHAGGVFAVAIHERHIDIESPGSRAEVRLGTRD